MGDIVLKVRGEVGMAPWARYFVFECPHCGRVWDARGMSRTAAGTGNTGFIKAAAAQHSANCKDRTPEERRAEARAAERRWSISPPTSSRITNNWDHPGMALSNNRTEDD